jgi:hypothetical protein
VFVFLAEVGNASANAIPLLQKFSYEIAGDEA